MEDNILDGQLCSEYIYSEDYLNFLVRYNNDLQGVYDRYNPACVTIINNRFLVAFRRISDGTSGSMFRYGYNAVPKCYGLMDITGVVDTGADRVRILPGLSLTGRDTLIGFVDTGIDYTNPLFRNPDGSTRIDYIWDQSEEVLGTGAPVFGYGAEFSGQDINAALASDNPYDVVPSRDENGHGTFMASVAAGAVNETENFSGMAPECHIVAVKLKQVKRIIREFYLINEDAPCYGEDDIILGVKYLISKAAELGRPMVICLGIGTSQGDHNGNTNLEQYLDSIVNLRGICVVTSAGNELGFGNHYYGNNRVNDNSYENQMEIHVGSNDRGFSMEIWGNAPGLLKISILSPTGERFDNISPIRDGATTASFLYEGTNVYIENTVVESTSGDQLIFLRFENPAEGIWTVNVTETIGNVGRNFDAWLPIHGFMNSNTMFVRPDPDITLCSPGNGRGVITTAGYNHYTKALYVNSSRGYTRNGRIKPDITAPAVNVYGAFARTGGGAAGQRILFIRMDGTSIASAFTAGAASLILEWALVNGNNPGINTESIKQMFIRGARHVVDVSYPNRAWGAYGIIMSS